MYYARYQDLLPLWQLRVWARQLGARNGIVGAVDYEEGEQGPHVVDKEDDDGEVDKTEDPEALSRHHGEAITTMDGRAEESRWS